MYKVYTYENFTDVDGDKCNVYVINPNGSYLSDPNSGFIGSIVSATKTITFLQDPNYWIGVKINVRGTAANDGVYTIESVSGGGAYVLEEPISDQGAVGIAERIYYATIQGHIYDSISYGNYMVVLSYGNDVGFGDNIFLTVINVDGSVYSSRLVDTAFSDLSITVLADGSICVMRDSQIYIYDIMCRLSKTYVFGSGFHIVGYFMNMYVVSDSSNIRLVSKSGDVAKEYPVPGVIKIINSSKPDEKWIVNYTTNKIGVIDKSLEILSSGFVSGNIVAAVESMDGYLYVGLSSAPVPTIEVYSRDLSLINTMNLSPVATTLNNVGIDELGGIWVDTDIGVYRWKNREGMIEDVDGSLISPPAPILPILGLLEGDIGSLPYNLIYGVPEKVVSKTDSVVILSEGVGEKSVVSTRGDVGGVAVGLSNYYVVTDNSGSFNTVEFYTKRFNYIKSIVFDFAHDITRLHPVRSNSLILEYISVGGVSCLGLVDIYGNEVSLVNSIEFSGVVDRKISVSFSGMVFIMEEDTPIYKLRMINLRSSGEGQVDVLLSSPHDLLRGSMDYIPSRPVISRDGKLYIVGSYISGMVGPDCDLNIFIKEYDGLIEKSENILNIGTLTSSSPVNTENSVTDTSFSVDAYDDLYFAVLLWNGNPSLADPVARFSPVNSNVFPGGYLSSGSMDKINLAVDFDNIPIIESLEGNISRVIKVFAGNENISPSVLSPGIAIGSVDYDAVYKDVWNQIFIKEYRGGF